jgi:hypothetical protein
MFFFLFQRTCSSSRLVSSHVACARANTSQGKKKEQNASTDRPEVGKTTRLILVSIRKTEELVLDYLANKLGGGGSVMSI